MGMDLNKRIEIKNEKQIKTLVIIMFAHYCMMYLYDILCHVHTRVWHNIVDTLLHFVIALPVFIVYRKIGLYKEELDIKSKRQYFLVLPCSLIFFGACYFVFGLDFGNDAYVVLNSSILWYIVYYFFVVALTEEFVSRVYILGELSVLLGKAKWLAPIISGVFFGAIHSVNMWPDTVYMNIIVGILLGYAKLYIKNCTFITCVLAHGLYDFVITVTGW